MNILLVGGDFNSDGGRPSGAFRKISEAISSLIPDYMCYNGGYIDTLHSAILPSVKDYDIVLWGPNVPNTEEKLRNVKEINPKTILISTKRNNNGEYSFTEIISRALASKANLVLEFSKTKYQGLDFCNMRIIDPLGNIYYDGLEIPKMVKALVDRVNKLTQFTRIGSERVEGSVEIPNEEEFFAFARSCSDIFHNLINPVEGTTRFLGNISFRCQNGFPSFRGKDNIIYVSRRNVDKRTIDASSFVATYRDDDKVKYYGEYKPSVDTPIQQRLYELFPQINYMIHAHCYFDTDIKTKEPVPCGAIEEIREILTVVGHHVDDKFIAINLIGHGCILMANDVSMFTELMDDENNYFIKRPVPEYFI